jgi:hypothetical protein
MAATTSRVSLYWFAASIAVALFVGAGCTMGSTFWSKEVVEEIPIDAAGLARLEAESHHGSIEFVGRTDGGDAANVTVTKRGGGSTPSDAEAALRAIEVKIESAGSDGKRISHGWKTPRSIAWSACVSYKIVAPARLALVATSYNGDITVSKAAGGADLTSHNGAVKAEVSGGPLHVETYNGSIHARYEGGEIRLMTHNGEVEAELGVGQDLRGEITSYNGGITLAVADGVSTDLTCETYNGGISCDAPWQVKKLSRSKITGRLGDGGGQLDVTTHNGSIEIKKAATR